VLDPDNVAVEITAVSRSATNGPAVLQIKSAEKSLVCGPGGIQVAISILGVDLILFVLDVE